MELVIGAHKSLAVLGVIGRAEDMHAVMDAERDATLAYLDDVTRRFGGRRGRAGVAAETSGLVFAHTRHATSRAGDPAPHDHVLVANLVEMRDERGGWKAADTTVWREHLHAATVTGRVAAARRAVELGYAIEPDDGPSGRLGQWRIAGIPVEAEEVFSKRAAEMTAAVAERGVDSYRARQVAARTTRTAKRFTPVADLMGRWQAELAGIGLTPEALVRDVDRAGRDVPGSLPELLPALSLDELKELRDEVFAPDGRLAARKVFARRDVVVAVGPGSSAATRRSWSGRSTCCCGTPRSSPSSASPAPGSGSTPRRRSSPSRPPSPPTFLNGVEATGAAAVPSSAAEAAIARKESRAGRPAHRRPGRRGAGHHHVRAGGWSSSSGWRARARRPPWPVSATPTRPPGTGWSGRPPPGRPPAPWAGRPASRAAPSRRCCGASTTAAKPSTPTRWSSSTRSA